MALLRVLHDLAVSEPQLDAGAGMCCILIDQELEMLEAQVLYTEVPDRRQLLDGVFIHLPGGVLPLGLCDLQPFFRKGGEGDVGVQDRRAAVLLRVLLEGFYFLFLILGGLPRPNHLIVPLSLHIIGPVPDPGGEITISSSCVFCRHSTPPFWVQK